MNDVGKKLLYLSRNDVESLNLSISQILSALENMFLEKAAGKVEMPPKPAIHTQKDAFLHAMPAYISGINSAGMKWVGGYPENYKKNLPYITGLLVLNDVETGVPYAVMDCTWITAIRTAAATALTARFLAHPDAKTAAILGCGVQGRYNLDTLNEVFSLSKVKIFDISEKISNSYQNDMSQKHGLDIRVAKSPKEAVADADIIVTAGPFLTDPKPVIELSWIKPGALVCPLDLDSYVQPEVFLNAAFLCTDDLGQYRHFKKSGLFKTLPDQIPELAQVVAGKITGRENPGDIISAINIGIALEDMAVAPLIYEKACQQNKGVWLDL